MKGAVFSSPATGMKQKLEAIGGFTCEISNRAHRAGDLRPGVY